MLIGDDVTSEECQHQGADDLNQDEDADADHGGGQEDPAQHGGRTVGAHASSSVKISRRSRSSVSSDPVSWSGSPDRAVETLRISAVSTAACWGGAGIGPVSGKRSRVS